MANNRMYLRCPVCRDSKPFMIAKYYPSTGWFAWEREGADDQFQADLDSFFDVHRHDSQWGNGFVLEYEIAPDYQMENPPKFEVSKTDPFPLISTSDSDSPCR